MEDILSAFFLVTNHTILKLVSEKNKISYLLSCWKYPCLIGFSVYDKKSKMGFPKYYTTAKNSMIKFWNLSFESKECSLSIELSLIKRLNMKMYAKIYIISRHCSYFGHVDLIKHEAEVDPQHLLRQDTTFLMPAVTLLPSWLFLLPLMLLWLSNMNALRSQLKMEF